MLFVNDVMQAVLVLVCGKHAPGLQDKLHNCSQGNWYVLPSATACRVGYWPHASESHDDQGCAVLGFVDRVAMSRMLQRLASVNEDGSLCPDCVAYEWNISPLHIASSSRDPVCGKTVNCEDAFSHLYKGELFMFCSIGCRDAFHDAPQRYAHVREEPAAARRE